MLLCITTLLYGKILLAVEELDIREVDQHYSSENATRKSLFQTLPPTHITPLENDLIFALGTSYLDTKVSGKNTKDFTHPTFNNPRYNESLALKNQSVSPFFAYSGKYFGIGLSGEFGSANTKYSNRQHSYFEESKLTYRGIGTQVFLNPLPKIPAGIFTLVSAIKVLNVSHKARSNTNHPNLKKETWEEFNYNIYRMEFGGNVNLSLGKSLSLIPWVNYTKLFSDDINRKIQSEFRKNRSNQKIAHLQRYAGDLEMYWLSEPPLTYGLDVAVKFDNFRVHLGNIMGILLRTGHTESERIKNRSFKLTIIYRTGV